MDEKIAETGNRKPESPITRTLSFLSGKKTYLVAALGVVYALGIKYGHWPNDPEIWGGLGFTGVATLRAAITKLCVQIAAAPPATLPDSDPLLQPPDKSRAVNVNV